MRQLPIIILIFIINCCASSKIDWSNSFWGSIETEESYIYTSNSLTSITFKEIKKGTILYFHDKVGDFQIIYTVHPKKFKSKKEREKNQFYLYKPKYKKLNYTYNKTYATIFEMPVDLNRQYYSGPRGGCYYINSKGNKIYVTKIHCKKIDNKIHYNTKSTTDCGTVQCSGRTKKGTRCRNKTTKCSGRCHLH